MNRSPIHRSGLLIVLCSFLLFAPSWPLLAGERLGDSTDHQLSSLISSPFELGRMFLAAGQLDRAQKVFEGLWNDKYPGEHVDPDCLAFYLATLAECRSNHSLARRWYERAIASNQHPDRIGLYSAALLRCAPKPALNHTPSGSSSIRFVALIDSSRMSKPDHSESESLYNELVVTARKAVDVDSSIENRIKLMSALLLYAEYASRPTESLFTTANDCFAKGMKLYNDIDGPNGEMQANKEAMESRITKTPEVAMRLDAVRARKNDVEKKEEVSRSSERQRLADLRRIVEVYRDGTGQMSLAMTYLLLQDHQQSREAIDRLRNSYKSIQRIVDNSTDYYLLATEPDDPTNVPDYVPIPPFTKNLSSQLSVITDSLDYRRAVIDPAEPNRAALDSAIRSLQSSIDTEGEDPSNPLACYFLGLAFEARALSITHKSPWDADSHNAAKPDFTKAREYFLKARESMKSGISILLEDIEQHLAELTTPDLFLRNATNSTRDGKYAEAFATLRRGLERHESGELWYAWVESGLRAETDETVILKEFTNARDKARVFRNDDYRTAFVHAKAELARALKLIAVHPLEHMTASERMALTQQLGQLKEWIAKEALPLATESAGKLQCLAFHSLAEGIDQMLLDKPGITSERVRAYEIARDASAELNALLQTDRDRIDLQEALVASRLAEGYLAVLTLEDWRDDAIVAFSAAIDEDAKLPHGRSHGKILGAPLMTAMRNRPTDADERHFAYERQLRQAMQLFVDGAVALQLQSPDHAAFQMKQGLDKLGEDPEGSEPAGHLDAATLLAEADGIDVKLYLPDLLRTFKVLAHLDNGDTDAALVDAIRAADPQALPRGPAQLVIEHVDSHLLSQAVSKASSPMVTFALGRAIEERVTSFALADFPDRQAYLTEANKALTKCNGLLIGELRQRYPVLTDLLAKALFGVN